MSANPPIVPPEIRARLLAVRDALAARHCATNAGQTWRDVCPTVREVVVLLALDMPRHEAKWYSLTAWEAFKESEREKIGSTMRLMNRETMGAGVLR